MAIMGMLIRGTILVLTAASCAVTPGSDRQGVGEGQKTTTKDDAAVTKDVDQGSEIDDVSSCGEYLKIESTAGKKVTSFAFVALACSGETAIVTGYSSHKGVRIEKDGDEPLVELEIRGDDLITADGSEVVVGKLEGGEVRGDLAVAYLVKDEDGYRSFDLDKDFGKDVDGEVVLRSR